MPVIGLVVIGQTVFQRKIGINIPARELSGLVISFIILGIISITINVKFMKYIKKEN